MAEEGLRKTSIHDAAFLQRRADTRAGLPKMQAKFEASGNPQGWFDELYKTADGDEAQIPWADMEPHAGLAEWIGKSGHLYEGLGIDIGCGLGDNAEALSDAGYTMTAFDLSAHAIEWAKARFPHTMVDYQQADLFDLPQDWIGKFDFVHECYTIQPLQGELRDKAFAAVVSLVKPGGMLLVNTRYRLEDEKPEGPPWPLTRSELDRFVELGLVERSFDAFNVIDDRTIPHYRVLYSKPGTTS